MDAFECIMSRQSVPPAVLVEPAPAGVDLRDILEAAMRAPDHAALRPCRFLLIEGAARERLGDIFANALVRRDPGAGKADVAKARAKPQRSPLIIALWIDVVEDHPKTPVVEQLATGAAAAQNMLNVIHAKGFGGILLTGSPSYDDEVKHALGLLPKDQIIGFIYVGTPKAEMPKKTRPDPMPYVRAWHGPGDSQALAAE